MTRQKRYTKRYNYYACAKTYLSMSLTAYNWPQTRANNIYCSSKD